MHYTGWGLDIVVTLIEEFELYNNAGVTIEGHDEV